jgi:AcrR family transcriptional regulator
MATSPRRVRERRTQEQRTAETRAKVIQATKECVADLGAQGATMSALAERAGVTWGAMQHQFGDKDGIFDAVLESCLSDLQRGFADLATTERDPLRRVHQFVLRATRLLDGPSYTAFVEIQLSRSRTDDPTNASWAEFAEKTLERVWGDVFGDLDLAPRKRLAAGRFFFVVMSGIAAESMLFPGVTSAARSHFAALESTLLRMLELER